MIIVIHRNIRQQQWNKQQTINKQNTWIKNTKEEIAQFVKNLTKY